MTSPDDVGHPARSGKYAARTPAASAPPPTADALAEERTRSYLLDLADRVRRGVRLVAEGEDRFFADDDEAFRNQRFGRMLVIEVAEIADGRLPQALRDRYPEIPWRVLRDVRNHPAHDYRGTGDRIVWEVLRDHLPRMIETLRPEYEQRGLDPATG